MKVIEIAFTAYPVTDMKRARAFYEGTLGLTLSHQAGTDEKGWVEYNIGPSTLSIGNGAPDWKAAAGGGSVALEVEDFDAAIAKLNADGHTPFMGPFETPVCHMAVVADPDGNSLIIHKRKPGHA